jgi:hypothetical protein
MTAPLIAVLTSGLGILGLIVFFRYEQSRRVRVCNERRAAFDRAIEYAKYRVAGTYHRVTDQTFRQSVHYVFHQILTVLLHSIQRIEASVRSVARFNKSRAKRRKDTAPTSHFSAIADHKRNTQLSDTQKQQRRDQALMGR